MLNDVLAAFVVFQAVFFFLDLYIYTMTNRDIARRGETAFFCALILVHMVYLVLNSAWSLQEYGVLHLPGLGMTLLCMGSFLSVSGCAFLFFFFTVEKIRFRPMHRKAARLLALLPELATAALILLTPWTGWIFRLDADNTLLHGPAYAVMLVSSSLYLLAVAGIAGYNLLTARTMLRRRSSAALLASVLIIITFVVADDLLPKVSILPVAVFAVIVVIFINMQESNINSDALTGMNNRRKAEEFLSGELSNVSEDAPLYLYICDLDNFKRINDVYGHPEGDEALLLCGGVLKRTAARFNAFAARFGGDEFLIGWHPPKADDADPEALAAAVNEGLAEQVAALDKPYSMTMSVGYTRCTNREETLAACIRRADEMLYLRKREVHPGTQA